MPRAKKVAADEVKKALADRPSVDSASLLNDLIDVWGGTRKLASDLYSEYQGAHRGSLVRQRILEMLQRLVITNTQNELSRPRNPEDLEEADLDRLIDRYVDRLANKPEVPSA